MPNNTKVRHEELFAVAVAIVEPFGIELLDSLSQRIRQAQLRDFATELQAKTGCHRETARIHIARACRRLRSPDRQETRPDWGGMRPGGFGRK